MQEPIHDLDSLAALVEGRLGEQDRQRVVAHIADCVECRRTLARVAREFAAGALAVDVSASPKPRLLRIRPWMPIAASVLIATVGGFYFISTQRATVATSPDSGAGGEDLLRRRGTERTVAGKTFRLQSGVWVDTGFEPSAGLESVNVSGLEQRATVLVSHPELTPYTELGDRVVVVWERTVYRFEP
jgi:hypothetical protein